MSGKKEELFINKTLEKIFTMFISHEKSKTTPTTNKHKQRNMKWTLLSALNMLFVLSSLVSNVVLLLLLYIYRHRLASKLPTMFMSNLLVSQTIITIFSFITEIDYLVDSQSVHQVSIYTYKVYDSFLSTCNFSFAAINMDRYVSVRHPLRYHYILTPRKIMYISAAIFTFPALLLSVSFIMSLSKSEDGFLVTGTLAFIAMILTSIILMLTNLYIYNVIIRHRRKQSIVNPSSTINTISSNISQSGGGEPIQDTARTISQKKQSQKTNRRMINTVMILSTSYVILSMPEIARLVIALTGQSPEAPSRTVVMVADLTMNISFTLIPVSMAIRNELIFGIIRRALRNLSTCHCK